MDRQCMVGERIFRNYAFLKMLATTKSQNKRLDILKDASTDQLLAVVEAAANIVMFHTFCLNKRQIKKLLPFEKYLIQLSQSNSSQKARNLLQKGEGAFWPALLIPVLIEVTRSLLNK
jgi:hypothetical protein